MKILIHVGTVKIIVPFDEETLTPDLVNLPEYSHNALLSAFNNGHYEVITAIETFEPSWSGFSSAVFFNSHWQQWAIPADVRNAIISAAVAELKPKFENAYGIAKSLVPPSQAAIESWQTIADQYYVPLVF